MSTYTSQEYRRIDYRALDAFLTAKGLVPRSLKWMAVRHRHLHKFRGTS